MKRSQRFLKPKLLSVAVAASAAAPAMSQQVVEEVLVTGIRQSLVASMDTKRENTGVSDVITAEDIGKFPDTNLAESLQRITGVSIDRTRGEGDAVTVRGLGPDFNLVTLNGRQMPNSSAIENVPVNRSFKFREIASDSVSAVIVQKTGKASSPSGGIGATINLQTAKPLDFDDTTAQITTKGVIEDGISPEISGMIALQSDDRKLGLLVAASSAERKYEFDRIGTQNGWINRNFAVDSSAIDTTQNPSGTIWAPTTVDLDRADFERKRDNLQIVAQFAPTETITITVDRTESDLDDNGSMNRASFWFDTIDSAPPTGSSLAGQGPTRTDANGTIINPIRTNDELNFWAWEFAYETENESNGLNIEFQPTDTLTFSLDYHNSTSHANPGGLPSETIANLKNRKDVDNGEFVIIAADFSGKIPTVSFDDSNLPGGAYASENIASDLYQRRGLETVNTITQTQFDGSWTPNSGFIGSINFGLSQTTYNVSVDRISNFEFVDLDLSDLDINFVDGGIGFDQFAEYSAADFVTLADAQGAVTPVNNDINGVEEDTRAAYLEGNFQFEDIGLTIDLGVRYEDTDVEAFSLVRPISGFDWRTELELAIVREGAPVEDTLSSDYDNVLPNLDITYEFADDFVVRGSYSTTIARSAISAMYPSTQILQNRPIQDGVSTADYEASQGNPGLIPYESVNFDFSLEWYYTEGSYASVAYFTKDVDNYIAPEDVTRTIEGPDGPLTNSSASDRAIAAGCPALDNPACISQPGDPAISWVVRTPANQRDTAISGVELNVQHLFGDSGFGVIANYTYVDADDEFDINNTEENGNDFAISGVSDTANLVAFYDNYGFQARVSYNWRDSFLQLTNNRNGLLEPTIVADYSQIDLNFSYEINDNVRVFLEGINVTDESTHRHGRYENQLIDYETTGPRYNIGASFKF